MLTIRFQRTGKRNRAEFRLIVAPKTAAAQKKFTEVLGSYNPRTKELVLKDPARLTYWLSQKLEISASAQNLLVTKKLLEAPKVRAFAIPKKEVAAAVVETPDKTAETVEVPAVEAVPESASETTVADTSALA